MKTHNLIALLGMLVAVGGCRAAPTENLEARTLLASLSGAYQLRSINGQSLPAVMFQDSRYRTEVLSENLTLNADGTFTDTRQYRFSYTDGPLIGTGCDCNLTGTYTATGDQSSATLAFNLSDKSQPAYNAAFASNQMTISRSPGPWVYQR